MRNIQIIISLLVLEGASIKACRASGRHIVALEKEKDIFDAILFPMKKVTPTTVTPTGTEAIEEVQVSQDLDAMTIVPRPFVRRDRSSK